MRKWLPKLVTPLPIFWKFTHPCLEIGDGTKLWECFGNYLIHFLIWFWNSFIKYFNPGVSFVVFSLHLSKGEINISLDSKCIDIVTKFRHIRIVFFFNGYLVLAFYIWVILNGTTSLTWCKSLRFNYFYPQGWVPASTVDLTAIYMPWYVCKLTNILDLAFWENHLTYFEYFLSMY